MFITAQLERRSGCFTGRVQPPHPHGAGKLAALMALGALFGVGAASFEMKEGTAAFLEKRKPNFRGH